ncbi:MAG: hypothetical protein M1376_14125 [Planctomycetes bacterium]|nr:hypothetical protein [Planctomycetota bacterium]
MRSNKRQYPVAAAPSLTLGTVVGVIILLWGGALWGDGGPFISPPNPVVRYSGGAGYPNDPFRISTAADLEQLCVTRAHWGLSFKLTSNIDLQCKRLTPIGTSAKPFTGSFDGGYHCIRNLLVYDDGSTPGGTGLFGVVSGENTTLSGVVLQNPTIIGNSADDVGALVGRLEGAKVWQCGVCAGRLFGAAGRDSRIGGLVGSNVGGSILECFSTATVEGVSCCGGLVGNNEEKGTVQDCYTAGRAIMRPLCPLDQPYRCGGLLGLQRGWVSFCYADTPVTVQPSDICTGYRGGFIGAAIMAALPNISWVLCCLCNTSYSPAVGGTDTIPGDISAVSRAALMQRATFTHWDFKIIWCLRPNATPRLSWEDHLCAAEPCNN